MYQTFYIKKTNDTATFRGILEIVVFYFKLHTYNYSINGQRVLISPKLETRTINLGWRIDNLNWQITLNPIKQPTQTFPVENLKKFRMSLRLSFPLFPSVCSSILILIMIELMHFFDCFWYRNLNKYFLIKSLLMEIDIEHLKM